MFFAFPITSCLLNRVSPGDFRSMWGCVEFSKVVLYALPFSEAFICIFDMSGLDPFNSFLLFALFTRLSVWTCYNIGVVNWVRQHGY